MAHLPTNRTELGLAPPALKVPPGTHADGATLLTEREARELLGLRPGHVARAVELGLLEAVPAGRRHLITVASAARCLADPGSLDPLRDDDAIGAVAAAALLGIRPHLVGALVQAGLLQPVHTPRGAGGPRFRRGQVRELAAQPPSLLAALQAGGRGAPLPAPQRRAPAPAPELAGAGDPDGPGDPDEAAGEPEEADDGAAAAPLHPGGFRLDPFQAEAEQLLEAGHHVLVSAPTGAGKSLIAERLVERAIARGQGFIYTGPIKALINQKFRDFCRLYGPGRVGIITGDVVIRDEAPILVMTTEIFRNMAVGRPGSLAGYHYLVLDEVHYLDSDRGATWEESIIFAPAHLQILALSATVANAAEIAEWIAAVTGRSTRVVLESRRPVPLAIHYAGPSGRFAGFDEAMRELQERRGWDAGGRPLRQKAHHVQVIRHVARRGWLPCLYFVFSRAGCEEKARELAWQVDLLDEPSRSRVEAHLRASETDTLRGSGGYRNLRECLVRGVAFHHAGMLPQAKELVEELYERGLVKALYCTETFAVGVNFPVKSAVFDGARKFDGEGFRPLTALEFHQMAGRAGRRGIDREGHAVLLLTVNDREGARDYARVQPEPVISRLTLRPNTVLNLVATRKDAEIRALLTRSLKVYQADRQSRQHEARAADLRARLAAIQAGLCAGAGTVACPAVRDPMEAQRDELLRRVQGLQQDGSPRARRELARAQERLQQVELHLAGAEPLAHTAEQAAACRRLYPELIRLSTELRRHEKKARRGDRAAAELLGQFDRLRDELARLGYLEGDTLLPRGLFAREVHVEEVCVTELYFAGFFHKAREEEICALLAGLAYDGKEQMDTLPRKPSPAVRAGLDLVRRYAENFNRGMFGPAHDWARGRDFVLTLRDYQLAEGDLIGALRRCLDLLRQVRRAVAGDAATRDRIERCIRRLDRPPVTVDLE